MSLKSWHCLFLCTRAVCAAAIAATLLSCGGGGGGGGGGTAPVGQSTPPFIAAELDSFPPSSAPTGFNTGASVVILDASTGASISTATVSMNAVNLAYNATVEGYEGNVVVAPGGTVTLNVTVQGRTYTASTTQFTTYPTITAPASGATWDSSVTNNVTWSSGFPTAGASYALGVLDPADPNGALVWPLDDFLQVVPIGTTSFSVPPLSLSGGNRLLVVGIGSSGVPISGAAAGSFLAVGGFTFVPITVPPMPVTLRASPATTSLNGVTWSGTQFVAVGDAGTIVTSPDGITWTARTSGRTSNLHGVVWSGTKFVAVGHGVDVGTVVTSPDGITWTAQSLSNISFGGVPWLLNDVAWSGTRFAAVGGTQNTFQAEVILTSSDGITWAAQTYISSSHALLAGVTWSGTQFVAVGGTSEILTSADGITWTARAASPSSLLDAVSWSGTQFVTGGTAGTILTSPDGITWTAQSSGTGDTVMGVAWSGTQWVAVGTAGTVLTSPDAITWTRQASGTSNFLAGAASSGTRTVIVGASGMILTLP